MAKWYNPILTLKFDPPIEQNNPYWWDVCYTLKNVYPEIYWASNKDVCNFPDTDKIYFLFWSKWIMDDKPSLTYSEKIDTELEDGEVVIDGYKWVEEYKTDFDKTSKWFGDLNESTEDIFKNDESLNNLYLGMKVERGPDWRFGNQDEGSTYGIIVNDTAYSFKNKNGVLYDITYWNHIIPVPWVCVVWLDENGNELNMDTYVYSDKIKSIKPIIDYDETSKLFESENIETNNPLENVGVVIDGRNTIEDIKFVINSFKEYGFPSDKRRYWDDDDIRIVYEDYIRDNVPLVLIATIADDGETFVTWGDYRRFKNQYSFEELSFQDFIQLFSGFDTHEVFDQLNESEDNNEYSPNHPLLFTAVLIKPEEGIEGIKTVLDIYNKFNIPTSYNRWHKEDIEIVYDDFLRKGIPLIIGVDTRRNRSVLIWGPGNKDEFYKYRIFSISDFISMTSNINTSDVFDSLY